MSTRIQGDNVRVPGYIFLENPLIGANQVLATGPNGEIISASVSIATLQALQQATADAVPDTLVIRTPTGGGKFVELIASGALDVDGNSNLAGLYIDGTTSDVFQSMLSIQMGLPASEGVGLTIKARDSQTVNYFQWTDTSGTPLGFIDKDGNLSVEHLQVSLLGGVGKVLVSDADGFGVWKGGSMRIKDDQLQLKNADDGLFYDLKLRTVAGVPTISVEGSGEA